MINWEKINQESKNLHISMTKLSLTISTAESCTGGMLASAIIHNPGSSKLFNKGYITYSNESKILELEVNPNILKEFGAVSEKCCLMMAKGLLKKTASNLILTTTGIAGPEGSSNKKPIGLVWICHGDDKKQISNKFVFEGNRLDIRLKTTYQALKLTNDFLKKYYL